MSQARWQRGLTQLHRYSKAWEAYRRTRRLPEAAVKLYLTPAARPPKDEKTRDWQPMSHRELVRTCVAATTSVDDALSVVARHNVAGLVWDLVTGPLAVDRGTQRELLDRLRDVLADERNYFRWRRWVDEQVPEFDALLRALEGCYVNVDE